MTRRILSAALAGLLVLPAACTDGGSPSASPSATGSSTPTSAGPTEPSPTSAEPTSPSAEPTPTSDDPGEPAPPSAEPNEPSPSATPPPPTDPEEQALLDQVPADGTLSVIVEVALARTAAPNSAERRRLIAEAQDDLIAGLDPAHVSVQTRFENTAQLTLTVDEEGLRALFASSAVTHVWENESIPLE
ncbi:hypothetical protein [Promicromonospora soli]